MRTNFTLDTSHTASQKFPVLLLHHISNHISLMRAIEWGF